MITYLGTLALGWLGLSTILFSYCMWHDLNFGKMPHDGKLWAQNFFMALLWPLLMIASLFPSRGRR